MSKALLTMLPDNPDPNKQCMKLEFALKPQS